jgi:hypothetical protein
MKKNFLAVIIVCAAIVLPAFALAAPPQLPHIFYGNALNDGNNLPVNTVIVAKVNGVEKGRVIITEAGKYGGSDALDEKLLVQGDVSGGATISFYIGNNSASQTASFISGKIEQLNLSFDFDKVIVNSNDLPSLISNGTFSISGSNTSASSVNVVQPILLNAGFNSVSLPQGMNITKVGGGNFDATALTAIETAVGSLSGLGSGVVAKGALQWGIASLGLEFSSPITIKIYVGTDLNGQTFDVIRSVSGSSGWTSDGIAAPATCVVASGFCSFNATKASYYVASKTTTTSSDGGGGGGGGLYITSVSNILSAEAQKVDFNKDNKIDILDFNALMVNWGSASLFDFNLLMINWTI